MSVGSMSLLVPGSTQASLLLLAYQVAQFIIKLYHVRSMFQRMQKETLVNYQGDHSCPSISLFRFVEFFSDR